MIARGELPPQAIAALQTNGKIEAIKLVRKATGCGLKEAKDSVEDYLRAHPELQAQLDAKSSSGESVLGWLFMLIVAIAAIVYFWPRG